MARTHLGTIPDFARRPTTVLVDSFKAATGRDPVRPLHRQYARGAGQSKRITIRGDAIVITNGRRITHATDDYDMTEVYRPVASVP